jgi:precorrin-3B C17-methyltransferase
MNGKIYIVGTGPGAKEHMSLRAIEALKESDVIVGYKTYIDLLSGIIEGKTVISSGMRRETERCSQVIGLAAEGKTVSLISSGDPGVYGMAGILLEMLHQSQHQIAVEIVPGITSALSSASLAGAPLMNDFAVISLSDLMTPWEVIENRIDKAAQGDFVMCIYNPKSAERVKHIENCAQIVSKYRKPDTPVAIVRDAMREGADVTLTTLAEITLQEIDMTTTVIIGNSQTFVSCGKMITPRGYTI